MQKTTIKISKELSKNLSIVSTILDKPKETLTEEILQQGLEPYLKGIVRQRFS